MARAHRFAAPVVALLSIVTIGAGHAPQVQRPRTDPLPAGQRLVARDGDGDVVVIDEDSRVRVVRHREANVRTIFNAAGRWLVILADYVMPNGADGRVDITYTFSNVTGTWPLEARWDGTAGIEDVYLQADWAPQNSFALITPRGLVHVLSHPAAIPDPTAIAVLTCRGSGRSAGASLPFEEAERRAVASASQSAGRTIGGTYGSSMTKTMETSDSAVLKYPAARQAPIRVGGGISTPVKLVDAKPVYPEAALKANLSGVVILEIVIDAEGAVSQARVLRSIPLLDDAAVVAAKQWRFTPTLLNGAPVPVIMTVTVPFPR